MSKPHWRLGRLADRLSDTRHRLNELTHGDLDVRATLALSYQALEPRAQVMFRRLGLLTVPDFPAWAAAALLDTSIASAEDFCERLVDAQLLDPVSRHAASGPRYRFHDLVRAYAEELAIATDSPTVRTAALARAFGGLMALSEEAHRQVYGGDFTILHGQAPRWTCATEVLRPVIAENPMTWLDSERIAILAAIRQCAELGLDELSWDLAWTAVTLYEARGYFDDWRAAQQFALAASREAGNARGTAAMLLAQASLKLNFNEPAEETLVLSGEALRLFSVAHDTHGCAIAQYQIGIAYTRKGQLNAALDALEHARDNSRAAGDRFLEAGVLRELANACLAQDDHQASMEYLIQALRIQDEIGSLRGKSMALYTLGELHLRRHDAAAARRPIWSTPRALPAAGTDDRTKATIVTIFLRGGADSLNAIVPYGDDLYYQYRPLIAVPLKAKGDKAVLKLDKAIGLDYWGTHPAPARGRAVYPDRQRRLDRRHPQPLQCAGLHGLAAPRRPPRHPWLAQPGP